MILDSEEYSEPMQHQDNIRHVCLLGESSMVATLLHYLSNRLGVFLREPERN